MKDLWSFPTHEIPSHGGVQKIYKFPNGYGASVIQYEYSYGWEEGLWELAVIKTNDAWKSWELCYETPITSDVIGRCTESEINELLNKISRLGRFKWADFFSWQKLKAILRLK